MIMHRPKRRKRSPPASVDPMAVVKPFRAIRPVRDKAKFVASNAYGDYGREALGRLLRENPLSFLHIVHPGLDPGDKGRQGVRARFLEFLDNKVLQRDLEPGFYLYQIIKEDFSSIGLFAACHLEDYRNGTIKRHEDTLAARERHFSDYLDRVGFNAEPVLMTFADDPEVMAVFRSKSGEGPDCGFMAPDGSQHRLWKVASPREITILEKAFSRMGALYIADGHHRCASSDLLARKRASDNPSHKGCEAYNYVMAYLIPESQVRIHGYDRLVRDLGSLDAQGFLERLKRDFRVEKLGMPHGGPPCKHGFSMYLEGSFYSLYLRGEPLAGDALSCLDAQILHRMVLRPLLGITDPRKGDRISYIPGKDGPGAMQKAVDAGDFAVGFSLLPPSLAEIKAIADAGHVMPPKSTYIEPKPKCGLAIYEV